MKLRSFNQSIFLSLLFLYGVYSSSYAESPNAAGAKQFAGIFFKTNNPQFAPGKVVQPPVLQQRYQSASFKQTPVFVFQNSEKGFAIRVTNVRR